MKLKILALGVIILVSTWFYFSFNHNDTILATDNIKHEPRITEVTAKPRTLPSRGRDTRTVQQTVYTMTATAYSYTGNPTASGKMPRKGLVVADWEQLPKGTKIFVEGYGFAEVADIGSLIKAPWNQTDKTKRYAELDLYFADEKEALKWGRKQIRVWVYE